MNIKTLMRMSSYFLSTLPDRKNFQGASENYQGGKKKYLRAPRAARLRYSFRIAAKVRIEQTQLRRKE